MLYNYIMFDKYLNSIIQDEKTRMYVGGAVVIYIACFTNMIPNNIKKLLKMPVVRMLILASIAYLSTINFEGALMVTIIYFATTNCMTYEENFSNLLKETISEETGIASYSTNSMEDGIQTYAHTSVDGIYSEDNRLKLNDWGKAAANDVPAGQCAGNIYENVADTVLTNVSVATDNAVAAVASKFGFNFTGGDTFEPYTETEISSAQNKCKHAGLEPVSYCAASSTTDALTYETNAFTACGGAFAKYVSSATCKTASQDGDNKCLDESGEKICNLTIDGGPGDCDEKYLDIPLAPFENSDGAVFTSHTLDSIKNKYLKGIVSKDSAGNTIYKIDTYTNTLQAKDKISGEQLWQITDTTSPTVENLSNQDPSTLNNGLESQGQYKPGSIDKKKLNSNYKYVYKKVLATIKSEDNIDLDTNKQENIYYIDIYIRAIPTTADPEPVSKKISEITEEENDTYFELVDGNPTYYSKKNNAFIDIATTPDIPQFKTHDGLPTSDEASAGRIKHPAFGLAVYARSGVAETYDLYTKISPLVLIYPECPATPTNSSQQEEYLNRSNIYTTELAKLTETANEWNIAKIQWENNVAKKIMRSIGCHRLREDSSQYGYWGLDASDNTSKCIYSGTQTTVV